MISQIATAATEQSSATEQVNANVTQISNLTQGASSAAEETAKSCAELSTMAFDLQNLVNQFNLGGSSQANESSPVEHAQVERGDVARKAQAKAAASGR